MRAANNSTVALGATAADRPAVSVAGSVGDRWAIDSDCCRADVASKSRLEPRSEGGSCSAGSVAGKSATFADTPRWDSPAARISDRVIDVAAGRAPGHKVAPVAHRTPTSDKPGTGDDFGATAWAAIVRCISVVSCRRGCCRDYCRSTVRPDRSPRLLSAARPQSPPAGPAENDPRAAVPAAIPERNWTPIH